MHRGDVFIAGEKGGFSGKPRPWLVVQSDVFLDDPLSVTAVMISASALPADFRVVVLPVPANGLTEPSHVLCDKLVTMRARSIDRVIGRVDAATLAQVDTALRRWLDL